MMAILFRGRWVNIGHCCWLSSFGMHGTSHCQCESLCSCLVLWCVWMWLGITLQWRHNEHDGVSNHQPDDGLLKHLFRRRSTKISKLHVTGLCAWNSPVTGEFPAHKGPVTQKVFPFDDVIMSQFLPVSSRFISLALSLALALALASEVS